MPSSSSTPLPKTRQAIFHKGLHSGLTERSKHSIDSTPLKPCHLPPGSPSYSSGKRRPSMESWASDSTPDSAITQVIKGQTSRPAFSGCCLMEGANGSLLPLQLHHQSAVEFRDRMRTWYAVVYSVSYYWSQLKSGSTMHHGPQCPGEI
jgi:hypothetical protein